MSQYRTNSSITSKGDSTFDSTSLSSAVATTLNYFTPSTCQSLASLAVTGLMPLTISDLHAWSVDPEGYLVSEGQSTPSDDVKSAGQQLLLALLESPGGLEVLGGYLSTLLSDFPGQLSAASLESRFVPPPSPPLSTRPSMLRGYVADPTVLYWDAVLAAAGVASYALDGKVVDFGVWFERSLRPSLERRVGGGGGGGGGARRGGGWWRGGGAGGGGGGGGGGRGGGGGHRWEPRGGSTGGTLVGAPVAHW
jgi:hypothetical protein